MNSFKTDREILEEISRKFQIYGELLHAEVCKIGHLNETYIAAYYQAGTRIRYIHQRINTNVFKNPNHVMENITRVTKHIRDNLRRDSVKEVTRRTLTMVPTREGKSYYKDINGNCWRTFFFIEGTRTYDAVINDKQAYQAGKAFAQFQAHLVDLKGERLHETIPHFHDTRRRLEAFYHAVDTDPFNRAETAKREIEFIKKREKIAGVILDAMADGSVPERITHNDTKLNNVMFDEKSNEAMCVVDLDTVMPGSVLYDFGDMVRTTTSPTFEDEQDLSKVRIRSSLFQALARGYVEEAAAFLTPAEKSLLVFSGKLITYTIGIRFLTDYLLGDTYFRVHRAQHNLDRSRTQLKLVESLEHKEADYQKFIDSL
ncbi:MAG: phosphotransferase enzyme family protein [Limisphaerales bacterium]|jgi:hypothetical protein|nr:aminoglycoside phosphotransferase family protein [Verrucomicrobiota bacterium]